MSFLFDFQDRRTYFGIGMAVLILVLPLFLNAYWTDVCVSIGLYAILALSVRPAFSTWATRPSTPWAPT